MKAEALADLACQALSTPSLDAENALEVFLDAILSTDSEHRVLVAGDEMQVKIDGEVARLSKKRSKYFGDVEYGGGGAGWARLFLPLSPAAARARSIRLACAVSIARDMTRVEPDSDLDHMLARTEAAIDEATSAGDLPLLGNLIRVAAAIRGARR